jgi:hypothetical protein
MKEIKKENSLLSELVTKIQSFNDTLQSYLPSLENEVIQLIKNESVDSKIIENYLDTLLSLTNHGFGDKLFVQLLDYYKTIDAEGALFYWNEYDKEDEY